MVRVRRKAIKEFVSRLVEDYKPRMVVLFGSRAYGRPRADSDVDLMVLFDRCPDVQEAAIQIRLALRPRFPVDLLVRRTRDVERRVKQGDSFLEEVMTRGHVLHESTS